MEVLTSPLIPSITKSNKRSGFKPEPILKKFFIMNNNPVQFPKPTNQGINQSILNFPPIEAQPKQSEVSKEFKGRGKRAVSVGKTRLSPFETKKNDLTMNLNQADQLAKYCKKVLEPINTKTQTKDSSSFSPQDILQTEQEKSFIEEKPSQEKPTQETASIGRRRQKSLQTEKPSITEPSQTTTNGRRRQKSLQDKIPTNEQQQTSDLYRLKTELNQSSVNEKIIEVDESQELASDEQQNYQLDDGDEADSPNAISPKRFNHMITPKELVFGPNVKEDILKKHAFDVAQGVKYATKRVKAPPLNQLQHRQITLKRLGETFKKTLVLDLDETLIYAQMNATKERLPTIGDKSEARSMKVMIRPYAEEFLKEMSKEFEIIIFTAAEKNYAESMINLLDPKQQYVSYILHREHCLRTKKGLLIKDLRIIKNRDLKDMVIVDNFTPSFSFQLENGIPIITWKGESKDQELKYLMNYLLEAKKYFDMRLYNKEKLRLEDIAKVSPEKFAESG
jgi:CTD small phosphatase-like protein 2